ncbi:MAG: ABC transporter permease subunit [Bacilli bacterium]|jgi:putative aldouronate transport system permease protein|nr:ABC transporter permease subunit [Bacilli bacterium]
MESEPIAQRESKWHGLGKKLKQSRFLILMIIPAVVFYILFCYVPMYGILIAFTKYYPKLGIIGSIQKHWVGLDNFSIIFNNDPEFLNVLKNTILIGVGKIIISFVAAIIVALLINDLRMRHFKKASQIIVTFPHFLSWVVLAGFINVLFSRSGVINDIIASGGGSRQDFMSNSSFFLDLIFISDIWKEAGWSSIIYLATMAGISPELYEAADIDGATRLQKTWHITLPGIKPTAILLLILSVGGVLSAGFDQIFNLYNPLVYEQVDILDTYIYRQTFSKMANPGLATAIGLFKSIVSFILVISVDRIAKLFGERGII